METRVQEVRAGVRGGIDAARQGSTTGSTGRSGIIESSVDAPPAAGPDSEFDA